MGDGDSSLSQELTAREPLLAQQGRGHWEGSDVEAPDFGRESYEVADIPNLDLFLTRLYQYWQGKGYRVIVVSRLLNLLALGFTIAFSGFLLLVVNWGALQSECIVKDTCDIIDVALYEDPFAHGAWLWTLMKQLYLLIFSVYWLWTLAHFVLDLRYLATAHHFCKEKLGVSEAQLKTMTWPELVFRVVRLQAHTRLCVVCDLNEHDIVNRIMRKENYLIGMLNKGVLALSVKIPGLGREIMLTKTMEWNLYWCVLNPMFDEHGCVRKHDAMSKERLRRRFKLMAVANLLLAPFVLLFLIIYFFMRNAERFYHHPASFCARRWSLLAKWTMREFNELPHFVEHRLNAAHNMAGKYMAQFPSHLTLHLARFVAYVSGSFAAIALLVTLLDDMLLERRLYGHTLVWWIAVVGIVLAVSRASSPQDGDAYDPEAAMNEVVRRTHYLPRHWRGQAHKREVRSAFERLFQYKAVLFLQEVASVVLTPYVLFFRLPTCAPQLVEFMEDFTMHVEGVGDVCSLAAWPSGPASPHSGGTGLARHGNTKYGAPVRVRRPNRSPQGKMEKSLVSFQVAYPTWQPPADAEPILEAVALMQRRPFMYAADGRRPMPPIAGTPWVAATPHAAWHPPHRSPLWPAAAPAAAPPPAGALERRLVYVPTQRMSASELRRVGSAASSGAASDDGAAADASPQQPAVAEPPPASAGDVPQGDAGATDASSSARRGSLPASSADSWAVRDRVPDLGLGVAEEVPAVELASLPSGCRAADDAAAKEAGSGELPEASGAAAEASAVADAAGGAAAGVHAAGGRPRPAAVAADSGWVLAEAVRDAPAGARPRPVAPWSIFDADAVAVDRAVLDGASAACGGSPQQLRLQWRQRGLVDAEVCGQQPMRSSFMHLSDRLEASHCALQAVYEEQDVLSYNHRRLNNPQTLWAPSPTAAILPSFLRP